MLLWIIIGVVALAVDLMTGGFLFVWFSIGAIAALASFIAGANQQLQIIVFCVVSAICFSIGYPIVKRTLKKTVTKTLTQEESYIGRELILDRDIEKKALIKFEGIFWTLKSSGEPLKKGDKVKIVGIEGNSLVVKKIIKGE